MSKRNIYILIAMGITAAILLFTIAILPMIVRSKAVATIEETTGRKTHLKSVSINPFTMTITVKDFAIDEKKGAPLISFKQVQASLALASIYKRALILSHVDIDTPTFSIARIAPNRYSFSDILDRQKPAPKRDKKSEFLFSINNITVRNGSFDFDDHIVDGGRKHTVRALEITIPFISNIPYLAEKYTDPRISAVVNNAPFSFTGKLKPLSKSLETSVHVNLKQLSLPKYVAYSPVTPPVNLTSGKLTMDIDVSYRISANKKPELTIKGLLRLEDINIDMKSGLSLVKLPKLEFEASRLEVFTQLFEFKAIRLDGLELFVSRDENGEWMYSHLLSTPKTGPKTGEPAENSTKSIKTEKQPLVLVSSLLCKNGTVHFSDALPKGSIKSTISKIDLALSNFSTAPDKTADYELSLLLDKDAAFSANGAFSVTPLAATSSVELTGLKIQRGWPYLARYLTVPVKGTLDLSADVTFSKEDGLKVEQGNLSLQGLSARYGIKEGFDLAHLQVNNTTFNQKESRLEVGDIRLSKGDISLSREIDGNISLLSLFKKRTSPADTESKQKNQKSKIKNSPITYHLKHFQVDKFNLAFIDKTHEVAPRFTLRNTNLSLSNLNGPRFTPAALRFSSTFGKDAPLKASGDITPFPFRYKGRVSAGRLPIRAFEAYFPDNINVFVIGGSIDTTMDLDISLVDGKPGGGFKGSAGVRAFHSIDAIAEEDLLKWESLQFDDIQGNLAPFKLSIHQVALNNVYSRIVVRKDGSLNLQNLIDQDENPDHASSHATPVNSTTKTTAQQADTHTPATPAKRQISVESVTIQDGTLSFTDNHLPQTFSSTFFNLGGRVSGLSSEESRFADVDLRGNLDNHSPLQITGKLNPLRDDLFVDLKVSFRDIDLSPVTPYSGVYLGYTVDKGKLFLDLKYLIDKKQLNSENKIFIDQFTFGRKVESDKATNLPVRLAVALLKDRKGEIHLDLPVTGRTDDPKFSILGVIGQVLKNLLVKAATSPFALLSSMMGIGQDFSVINFATGSSKLSSEEEQKLALLAKALADRPGLKMEIKGFVDKEKDPEGYRQELLGRKLRNEKFLFLVKEQQSRVGEGVETVQVLTDEYSKFLKAVYKKEKFPKPRNVLGLVKDLPDNEMKKLIIANTAVGKNELQSLARERAVSVMNHLISRGGLPPERLFQKNEDIYKAPEKDTTNQGRVEFNAIAQ
jgi:outer membrane protein OmpA-like peptidoglycan-associated protein